MKLLSAIKEVFGKPDHRNIRSTPERVRHGGFVTNGGDFRDGPPPPPPPPPPSRYDTFSALDNQLTQGMGGNNNFYSSPPPPPPPISRDEKPYSYEVFDYVAKTAGMEQSSFIDVGLSVGGANTPGQVKIHEIGRADDLNRQHYEEHVRANPNQEWVAPHEPSRMVVDYTPNKLPTSFERAYGQYMDGDPAHAQVFVTTVGSLSTNNLQEAVDQYQLVQTPKNVASVTLEEPSVVTRSIVARSTTGQVQYMVYRDSTKFEPK